MGILEYSGTLHYQRLDTPRPQKKTHFNNAWNFWNIIFVYHCFEICVWITHIYCSLLTISYDFINLLQQAMDNIWQTIFDGLLIVADACEVWLILWMWIAGSSWWLLYNMQVLVLQVF